MKANDDFVEIQENPQVGQPTSSTEAAGLREFAAQQFRHELPPAVLESFRRTNVWMSIGLAAMCLTSIAALASAMILLFAANWPLAMAFYPLAGAFIARQQRGLELLVHDGSHRAWCRERPWLNDMLTNVLAAYPSFTDVKEYWRFHRIHHSSYGSDRDPCKRRFEEMRSGFEPGRLLPTMLTYMVGWYREAARKPGALMRAAAWHLILVLWPVSVVMGWGAAAAAWTLFWLVPQLVFLPWLRLVAELEEHDYSPGQTESSGTFTNVGWLHKWMLHPLKDGYHLVHHAYPSVPQWKHAALHSLLMQRSALYRASRARTRLLGDSSALSDLQ